MGKSPRRPLTALNLSQWGRARFHVSKLQRQQCDRQLAPRAGARSWQRQRGTPAGCLGRARCKNAVVRIKSGRTGVRHSEMGKRFRAPEVSTDLRAHSGARQTLMWLPNLAPVRHRVCPGFLPLLRQLHPKLQGVHRPFLEGICAGPNASRAEARQGL